MITAEQRETRKRHLGASDIAAILGLNPFRTPADVYLEKTADLEPSEDTEAIEIGNDFERPLLAWAEREIGMPFIYNCDTITHKNGVMIAHLDAAIAETDVPVEAKVTAKTDDWGDSGTGVVPDAYLVQVHAQMMCVGVDEAYIAALLGGFRMTRRLYHIHLNSDLAKTIEDEALSWWDRHVIAGLMPDSAPSLEVVRRIKRQPGVVVPIRPELAEAYVAAKEASNLAKMAEDDARARLEAALAGADGGECAGFEVCFKNVNVKAYSVEARTDRRLTCKAAK